MLQIYFEVDSFHGLLVVVEDANGTILGQFPVMLDIFVQYYPNELMWINNNCQISITTSMMTVDNNGDCYSQTIDLLEYERIQIFMCDLVESYLQV